MKSKALTLISALLMAAATLTPVSAAYAFAFPTTGYTVIATDGPDVGIDPDRDITTVEYLQDGVNCYFRFTVVNGTAWGVSFANERFFVYIDLNSDGNSDYLLYTDNPTKTKLMRWSLPTAKWVDTYSNSAASLDPNATPDDHIYIGVSLADMGITDGLVIGASAGTANFKPTQRNPQDETTLNDVITPTPVGYGVLSASPVTAAYTQTVTTTATLYDTTIATTIFKWYGPGGTLTKNQSVAVVNKLAANPSPVFAPTDTGIWLVLAEYRNAANTLLDSDTVSFQVVAADADGDGHLSGADCNDADPNNWAACATCADLDGDGRLANCDAYVTHPGPDCNDLNVNAWSTCATCVDPDADGWFAACNQYLASNGPDCDNANPNAWNTCAACLDTDADGWFAGCNQYLTVNGPDCNDANPAVHPGAAEVCNGMDDNCNAAIDDGLTFMEYFTDADGDEFGSGTLGSICQEPANATNVFGDCDDANAAVNPAAVEVCDGIDNNCAAGIDEGGICLTPGWDTDGDGIPDDYEIAHAGDAAPLNYLDATDGAMDFDGDGNPNVHEYWNGTDPWTPDPVGEAGCFFWGEGNGDGYSGPPDNAALTATMKGFIADYSNVIPDTGETQDLNADTYFGPPDLALMVQFLKGQSITSMATRPVAIEQLSPATVSVKVGDTARLAVGMLNSAGLYTAGFGVVFSIDPTSTGTATILGGDGADADGHRYDVSGTATLSHPSRVVIRVDSAGEIKINASTPLCGGVLNMGRYCNPLNMPAPFVITGHE